MSSVLDVGARGPAGARIEGNLAAVNSAAQGSKFRGHKQFCDRCYLFKSDSAYQERSSPEMEEIWEEGAELELVRRTSPSISDAAWGPEWRTRAFVGALEDMATRVRLVWEE